MSSAEIYLIFTQHANKVEAVIMNTNCDSDGFSHLPQTRKDSHKEKYTDYPIFYIPSINVFVFF